MVEVESGRLRLPVVSIIISILTLLLSLAVSIWGSSELSKVAVILAVGAILSSTVVFFEHYLVLRLRKLVLSNEILESSYGGRDEIFELKSIREERSLRNFRFMVVPFMGVILGLFLLVFSIYYLNGESVVVKAKEVVSVCGVLILPFSLALFAGSYYAGLSVSDGWRWIRSVSIWLKLQACIHLLTLVALISELFGDFGKDLDTILYKVVLIILLLIGLDLIFGVIVDYYQSERAEEERSPLEPRMVATLLEPGNIAENVANLLNYQFGFKVSNSWLFLCLERAIVPLFLGVVLLGWLMSCVVLVESDSQGIVERFGKIEEKVLDSGIYFKLPYPFSKVHKYPVKRVHSFMLGDLEDSEEPEVVLWTHLHSESEEKYLLPSRSEGEDNSVAVSYLMVNIPVRYMVTNLYKYLYNFTDAKVTLREAAREEVLRYLASSDFTDFFTIGRFEASLKLKERIQARADELDIGVEIKYLNFMAVHPPLEVGEAFEAVASSMEGKERIISEAHGYANEVLPQAYGKAQRILLDAQAHSYRVKQLAQAESEQFISQLAGYNIFPKYYEVNNMLNMLIEQVSSRRKYVLPSGLKSEKYILNLEEKQSVDLLDLGN